MSAADMLITARGCFLAGSLYRAWAKANPGEAKRLDAYWQNGGHVELRGTLSPGAEALTQLLIDGKPIATTTFHNWSSSASPTATRARYGVVEGSQSAACVVTVSEMRFT